MFFTQPGIEYRNEGTIADGAQIAATGVRLINSDSGRLYGGVTFGVGGSTLVNELGGVVRLSQFDQTYPVVVTGSSGDDTVVNGGTIFGKIALGGGNDSYVDHDGWDWGIDLGSGDDVYRREGTTALFLRAIGGEGRDRVEIAGTGQYWGDHLTGFEDLYIAAGSGVTSFSGYQTITIAPVLSPLNPWSSIALNDCFNPLVDLTLSGHSLTLQSSALRSITGSDAHEHVTLGFDNVVGGTIALGGGDDSLALDSYYASDVPTVSGLIDAGSGQDTLVLNWFAAGDRVYDLAGFDGFEKLNVNAAYGIPGDLTARVSNLSGLTDIDIGGSIHVTLVNSVSPDARAGGSLGGGLTIEAESEIGRFGFADGPWDQRLDIAQGDPAYSVTILNHGTIHGEVRFYIGDDLYDGRLGSVGGTIHGNAGNDTMLGGEGAETMSGGYGGDILEGNGGADILTGGAGSDLFRGTMAGLNGDTITDLSAGDRILFSDANLADFSVARVGTQLNFTGGSMTLLSLGGRLSVSAGAGGGVLLTVERPTAANDFNGDGRSDVLWRHDSGLVTNWLARPDGSFLNNQGNLSAAVPNDWTIAGTGDFNGDGRVDLLWRHSGGQVTDWLGTSSGGFVNNQGNISDVIPTDWKVAGTGDFDGDGRDDIVWRHYSGLFTSWLGQADGGFANNHAQSAATIAPDWKIVATGDFNGDGRDDLAWRHDGGTLTVWLGTIAGGFANNHANAAAQVLPLWQVIGSGDFNGDGRDDLVWRRTDGAVSVGRGEADGGFTSHEFPNAGTVGRDWMIEGIGDYNGDGRGDLLWRHDSGMVSQWLGQSNGTFANNHARAAASVPNDWTIHAPDIHLF